MGTIFDNLKIAKINPQQSQTLKKGQVLINPSTLKYSLINFLMVAIKTTVKPKFRCNIIINIQTTI